MNDDDRVRQIQRNDLELDTAIVDTDPLESRVKTVLRWHHLRVACIHHV